MREIIVLICLLVSSVTLADKGKENSPVCEEFFSKSIIPSVDRSYKAVKTNFIVSAIEYKTGSQIVDVSRLTILGPDNSVNTALDRAIVLCSKNTINYTFVSPSKEEYEKTAKQQKRGSLNFKLAFSADKAATCVRRAVLNQQRNTETTVLLEAVCKGSDFNGFEGYTGYVYNKAMSTEEGFNKLWKECEDLNTVPPISNPVIKTLLKI